MILYLIYKNAKNKVEDNCNDQQQEMEGTMNSAQHKIEIPSVMEMKENIV